MCTERSQFSAVFCPLFTTCQVINTIASYDYQKNAFSNDTCLNVKHQPFIFQHIDQIYLNTYWHTPVRPCRRHDWCDRCISHWNNTSARSFNQRHFLVHKQTSYTKRVSLVLYNTCHHILDASKSEWYLGKVLLPRENEWQSAVPYGMLSAVAPTYLSLRDDVTVTSSS